MEPDKIENYNHCRSHFIERLHERYSITIDESEYDELVIKKPKYKSLYKLGAHNSLCTIEIKGKQVYLIYGSESLYTHKRFMTALTPTSNFPSPNKLARKGIGHDIFRKLIDDFIENVIIETQNLREFGQKQFFTGRPDLDKRVKKATVDYQKKGYFDINIAVTYIKNQINTKSL